MLITSGAEGPRWAVISFSGLGNQTARLTSAWVQTPEDSESWNGAQAAH